METGMSRQEDRAQKIGEWMQHLQSWKDSGKSLAAYARGQGVALWALYHWRGVLIREGRWQAPKASAKLRGRAPVAISFAKVAVTDLCPRLPVTVRLQLANGRRAEVELTGIEQLESLLGVLERQS
jgi:hypothetical protein